MLRDGRTFVIAVFCDWVAWMSGLFGLGWTIAAIWYPQIPPSVFGVLCFLALFIACFRVWRTAHREARPFSEETFRSVERRFNDLTDEERGYLEILSIDKFAKDCGGISWKVRNIGLTTHDPVSGLQLITPGYEAIIALLLKAHPDRRTFKFKAAWHEFWHPTGTISSYPNP
jgi:hypothetical protein